jgi:hypothetical protein
MAAKTLRAGDVVRTLREPIEDWVLACDEDRGRIMPAGWPSTIVDACEVELVTAATDEERERMLQDCAAMTEPDPRRSLAQRQLGTAPE